MSKGSYKDHIYALVLAGGGGTRLWPVSRNATPKQFINLLGNQTFTQSTLYRLNKRLAWERIFVITSSREYKKEIEKEVPEMLTGNIIVEPTRRDTAPAHAVGAAFIMAKDPRAIVINEAADHIEAPRDYFKTVMVAAQVAYNEDRLVAIGVKPTEPHTGYGYVKRGKRLMVIDNKVVYKLDAFTEKPKLNLATRFLQSGKYYWNANHYVWPAKVFIETLNEHAPQIAKSIERISQSIGKENQERTLRQEYAKMPKISVDYAVSEKANNFLLVTTRKRWTDIGDWGEVWDNLPKDVEGNVVIDGNEPGGDLINIGTSDALIHKDGRLIALVDVDDLVIVDTKDALLVARKSESQNVKKIVNKLKKDKRVDLL